VRAIVGGAGASTGYLALHSSSQVLVVFFSCAFAARVHDLPPTPGDSIFVTGSDWDEDVDGDGDLAAVGALCGCLLALTRWRGWLVPLRGRGQTEASFPWWLVVLGGFAGAVDALAMKVGQEGVMQGAARVTRAVPFLFYLPAQQQSRYGQTRFGRG
jgi:hypothetical protein